MFGKSTFMGVTVMAKYCSFVNMFGVCSLPAKNTNREISLVLQIDDCPKWCALNNLSDAEYCYR